MATVKRDAAHDPRKAPGAKAQAAKMKARAATFDKTAKGNGNGKTGTTRSPSGPLGSGLLEGARKAIVTRTSKIDQALKKAGG